MAKKIAKKPSRRDNRLTIYQIQFLEFMGIFVYITLSQAFRLGLGNNRGNFTKHVLARPKRMELLDWILPTETGYEYVYHLREKGAEQLVKLTNAKIEKIKYPTPKDYTWSGGYYLHSKYTIDCAIECYLRAKSLGIEILDYDIDLEKSYSKGEKKTTVHFGNDRVDPDSIFKIKTEKGVKLYALELERRDNRSLDQLDDKLRKHINALNAKAVSKKYNHDKAHRILFVCEHEATRDYIIQFLQSYAKGTDNWFLFKTFAEIVPPTKEPSKGTIYFADDVRYWKDDPECIAKAEAEKRNFFENWLTSDGRRISMY